LAQQTFDFINNEKAELSVAGRHDLCIALRVPVVAEAVAAIVFADLYRIDKKSLSD
jgi:chorismate synthase